MSTEPLRLLPMPGVRGLVLFFIVGIAATEVGLAVALAEAWRSSLRGAGADTATIGRAVERLGTVESVFVLGLIASAVVWLALLLINTTRSTPRHSYENHLFVRGMLISAVVMTVALVARSRELLPEDVNTTLATAALMWAPFALIDGASIRLATSRTSVRSWYAMLLATLVIHVFITNRFDLATTTDITRIKRTALLHASSALLMGLAALFAADCTSSLRDAIESKVASYRHLVEDARTRRGRGRSSVVVPGAS